jgi:HAD superfamily hydrolase (TIGR01490 family)
MAGEKELALFDLDNTLLSGDSDYEWAQFLIERGVLERAEYEARNDRFFRQYKEGRLDIHEFLDFQLAPLARHSRQELDRWHGEFMRTRVKPIIRSKGRDLVRRHLADKHLCAIITSTNAFITAPIARELGVEHLLATELEVRNGKFTGKPLGTPSFRLGKVTRLAEWLGERGQTLASFAASWFYSDSHNDLPLLERVTRPIAVDPDEPLRAHARRQGWAVMSLKMPASR